MMTSSWRSKRLDNVEHHKNENKMEDGTYWLEDTLFKTKRYFTIKDGFVECGTFPLARQLYDFFHVASKLGYRWGKL